MVNNAEQLSRLISTVYSKWVAETYGISYSAEKLKDCDFVKYQLRFFKIQETLKPKFEV